MNSFIYPALAALIVSAPIAFPTAIQAQSPTKAEATRKVMTSEELYEHTLKGTCWVVMQKGSGTGWVLDRDKRLVITNAHVVPDTDEVKVYFPVKKGESVQTDPTWYEFNSTPIKAIVIDRDTVKDLALLQLASLPMAASALPLAASPAKQGQEIMTIGASTMGSGGLWGWVDGKVRNVVDQNLPQGKVRQVESNVATNSGNSGGPVVNNRGEIVAVHVAGHTKATNMSFHIDLSELNSFLAIARTMVDPKSVADFIARGDRRLMAKRFSAARDDFGSAVKLDPKNARAHLGRGMATFFFGDNATAILDLDEAAKLQPEYFKAIYYRGRAKSNLNKLEEAAADFTEAIRIEPKSVDAYTYRGCALHDLKKFADAEADFSRAHELTPTDPLHLKNRGLAKEKQGRMDEAIADLEKAVELRPRDPKQYSNLGMILFRAKRYEESIKMHIKADDLDPNHHPLHAACVGDCLKEQEKWSNAVKLYNIALERSDKNFDGYRADIALCCRGYCLRRMENYDASLADHNRSLKINPNRAETYYQRAWTYRWMGQYNLAKEDYDKAVQLDADYANHEAPVVTRNYGSFYPGVRIGR